MLWMFCPSSLLSESEGTARQESESCGFASGVASRYSPSGMRKQQTTTELALLCICFPNTTKLSATGTGFGYVCVDSGITHGSDHRFVGVIIEAEDSSEEVGCGLFAFHVAG